MIKTDKSDAGPAAGSSTAPPAEQLCISITRPSTSIQRGHSGTFGLQVWTQNWASPSGKIKIALSTQPAGPVAEFTSCASGTKTATCTIAAPGSTPTALQAQVAVASNATSVSSVTLKAVASGPALQQLPTVAETAQVSGPGASSSSSSSSKSSHTSTVGNGAGGGNGLGSGSSIGVGPLPALNNEASSLIGAGNASGLFPQISPSDSPSPAPGAGSRAGNAKADPSVSLLPLGMPVVTAQVVGLIALAVALMLAMTRISLRRRPVSATPGAASPAAASPAATGADAADPDKPSTPKHP